MEFLTPLATKIAAWWTTTSPTEKTWLALGITGQLMFSMRWLLQWHATEKTRQSVVPATFWYYSLLGGLMVLCYGIYRADPVIVLGQFGILVYARNIYFLLKGQATVADPPPIDAHPDRSSTAQKNA
jgi:lipid-A-disaccharide synthase-like uncharacterized protein